MRSTTLSIPGEPNSFYAAIRTYWPDLPDGALRPDYAGIRPKIARPGGSTTDFLVQTEKDHGVAGLINLFGIKSPGLTSSLAIAEWVARAWHETALIALAVGPRGVAPSSRGAAQPASQGAQRVLEKYSPLSLPYDPLDCRAPLASLGVLAGNPRKTEPFSWIAFARAWPDLAELGFGLDRAWPNFNMHNTESVHANSRREPNSSRYKRHAKYAYEMC